MGDDDVDCMQQTNVRYLVLITCLKGYGRAQVWTVACVMAP